jgi:putative DNA primase/helicase
MAGEAVNTIEWQVPPARKSEPVFALEADGSPLDARRRRRAIENMIVPAGLRQKEKTKDQSRAFERGQPESKKLATGRSEKDLHLQEATEATKAPLDTTSMPDDVKRRFVQLGRKYHFHDGAHAFTDRGERLTTPSENTEVVKSLIAIAEVRGWKRITVKGTDRFRKEAWFQARLAGLEVKGYKPDVIEQEYLVRTLARQVAERRDVNTVPERETTRDLPLKTERKNIGTVVPKQVEEPQQRNSGIITGKLIDHGPSHYLHDRKQSMSYFVMLETEYGMREVWGVDFERALKESLSRPQAGDEVGLRSLGRQPVTVSMPQYDEQRRLIGETKVQTYRNRWLVERQSFLNERAAIANIVRDPTIPPPQAAKSHPSLVGSYMAIHAAELASKQISNPQQQARFVELFRNGLADSVERGEPLPMVKLKERTLEQMETRKSPELDQDFAPVRG